MDDESNFLDLKLVVRDYLSHCILSCLLEKTSFGVLKYEYVLNRVSKEYFELYGKKLTKQQFAREYRSLLKNKIIFEASISEKRKRVGRTPKKETKLLGRAKKLIGVNPYITQELNELLSKRCEKLIKILTRFLTRFEKHKEKVELEIGIANEDEVIKGLIANEEKIIKRLQDKLKILPEPPLTLEKIFKPFIDVFLNHDFIEYQNWEWDIDLKNNVLTIYLYFEIIKERMPENINVSDVEKALSDASKYLMEILEEQGIRNVSVNFYREHTELYSMVIELLGGLKHG